MSRDALVVGVSAYQSLPGLQAPAEDAEAIAQRLTTSGDFRVTRMPEIVQVGQPVVGVKTPVTLAELEASLVKLFKPKGKNIPQTALFYFSGHGLQKDAGIQEGYLATSDANPVAGFYGLSLFWLRRLLQESPVRQRIVLLDCCHSGELLNYLEADPGARSGTDRLFMAASREYEAAYESIAGKYSIFTQALLDGLDPARLTSGTVTNYALTDWVSNALKGEMQQPVFENSGSEIILTRCQSPRTVLQPDPSQEHCPYRGLECFDEAHAEYFFGREDLTDQLMEKLKTNNFVAVVGASGSGKSSLVRAGLIHQLRQGHKFSGSDRWRIQLITPTDQPLKSLASAFVNSQAPTVDRAEHLRRAEALLREGGTGLCHLVRASLISSKYGRNSRLLLIIDQFEEVFTLCDGPQAERDRHRFFNSLLTALREASDSLSIVIVLRADFFSKCSLYNGLAEQIERNLVTATPLTYDQIKASVVKPAQKAGLVCEPNLVYNILLDVVGAPGELPLLQYTLTELWRQRQTDPDGGAARLTLDAYTELGGVRGTLQKRADTIFYSLSPEEQQVAKRVFIALTQLGDGTEDTRRRILKSELVRARFPVELVDRVLEKLVIGKLIVMNRIPTGVSRHQEQIDQGMANVSTALRLAQMCQGKFPKQSAEAELTSPKQQAIALIEETSTLTNRLPRKQVDIRQISAGASPAYQETIDVAHEALIRNWDMLRVWLDENRDMLRRQRRLEHMAREWQNQQQAQSPGYLLNGERLLDAEDYLKSYPDELSELAQQYIQVSREESYRSQKELRFLQMVVPCTLLVALVVTLSQYWAAIQSQTEKDYQLRIATARQQAAIAQSLLQEPRNDPTTALLISRFAAEQGGYTYEAQASLRAALQKLQLQATLDDHSGAISQAVFSPDRQRLATAGEDGTVRIWSVKSQTVEHILTWNPPVQGQSGSTPVPITALAFSPDGRQLAAITQGSGLVQVWSVASGERLQQLENSGQIGKQLAYSSQGNWLAVLSNGNAVNLWQTGSRQRQQVIASGAAIQQFAFSPNRDQLFTLEGNQIHLWQVGRLRPLRTFRSPCRVNNISVSQDGRQVAAAGSDGLVYLWQTERETPYRTLNPIEAAQPVGSSAQPSTPSRSLQRVVFSPDGRYLAAIGQNSQVWLWAAPTRTLVAEFQPDTPMTAPVEVAFSPNSQTLAITRQELEQSDSTFYTQLWQIPTRQAVGNLRGHTAAITAVQFSPDGLLLVTAGADSHVRLWSTTADSEFPTLQLANQPIQNLVFRSSPPLLPRLSQSQLTTASPDPVLPNQIDEVMTVTMGGTVQTWSFPGTPARSPRSLAQRVSTTSLNTLVGRSPNFFSRLGDLMRFWGEKVEPPSVPSEFGWQSAPALVGWLAPVPALAQPNPTPQVEVVSSGRTFPQAIAAGTPLTATAFSASGRLLAVAPRTHSSEIWQVLPEGRLERQTQLQTPSELSSTGKRSSHSDLNLRQFIFSPNDQMLLGVGDRSTIYLWHSTSGQLLKQLKDGAAPVNDAQFSTDGQRLVSVSRDHTVRIWGVASGQVERTFRYREPITSARFRPDGQQVVLASASGIARIVDTQTGTDRVILTGHRGAVLNAQFSPDGQVVVTTSADGTARLWDAQTGTETAILRSGKSNSANEPIRQAFFSPDGRYVAALSQSGKLYLWVASWQGLLELARDRSLRQLQPAECLRYLRLAPNVCPQLEMNNPDAGGGSLHRR